MAIALWLASRWRRCRFLSQTKRTGAGELYERLLDAKFDVGATAVAAIEDHAFEQHDLIAQAVHLDSRSDDRRTWLALISGSSLSRTFVFVLTGAVSNGENDGASPKSVVTARGGVLDRDANSPAAKDPP